MIKLTIDRLFNFWGRVLDVLCAFVAWDSHPWGCECSICIGDLFEAKARTGTPAAGDTRLIHRTAPAASFQGSGLTWGEFVEAVNREYAVASEFPSHDVCPDCGKELLRCRCLPGE